MPITQKDLLEENKQEKIEVSYTKGKLSSRMLGFFIDLFLITFTTFLFYAGLNAAFQQADYYKTAMATKKEREIASGLYLEVDNQELDLVSYLDTDNIKGTENKKNFIATQLTSFYQNTDFFDDAKEYHNYQNRKLSYTVDNVTLFEKVEDIVQEKVDADPSKLLTFYSSEYSNHAIGFLAGNIDYANAQKTIFLTIVVLLIASSFLTYLIYVLILPLTILKRGRQTIGMKIAKVAYINVNATNIRAGKYIGRFFFSYFFYIPLNFVGFLIPSIVTMTMMFVSKTGQTLTEYLFNDYVVSVVNQDVYLDYLEYLDRQKKVSLTTIETNSRTLY